MKKLFFIAGFSVALISCNDDSSSTTTTTVDSSDHSTHDTSGTSAHTDTTGMSGKTMMSMMTTMMDNMKAMQSTGNPDNDFAAMMKAHHMGALEMAQVEVATGSDATMKAMAQQMIDAQQKEIAELNTFLSSHSAHGGGDAFFKEAMAAMNNMKMDMDHSGSVDKQFAQMMIPHHQSAIDMAKAYLKAGAHEEKLKTMSNNIITSQQKEIAELQAWLKNNE